MFDRFYWTRPRTSLGRNEACELAEPVRNHDEASGRRFCLDHHKSAVWGEVVAFSVLNAAGMAYASVTGEWRLRQFYEVAYFPIAGSI